MRCRAVVLGAFLMGLLSNCHSRKHVPDQVPTRLFYLSSRHADEEKGRFTDERGRRRRGLLPEGRVENIPATVMEKQAWKATLQSDLKKGGRESSVLVYVHGFNTRMAEATRTAQRLAGTFADKAGHPVVPVFHTWPSAGNLLGYSRDRNQVDMAAMDLATFLSEISEVKGGHELDLVGHSMGCEVILKALMVAQARNRESAAGMIHRVNVRRIVLAAPDVENSKFDELARIVLGMPSLQGRKPAITLYVNQHDAALEASTKVVNHGMNRAGRPVKMKEGSEIRVPQFGPALSGSDLSLGVESVDVSALYTRRSGVGTGVMKRLRKTEDFGHFAHDYSPVIDDLVTFLNSGRSATARGLEMRSYYPSTFIDTGFSERRGISTTLGHYFVFPES